MGAAEGGTERWDGKRGAEKDGMRVTEGLRGGHADRGESGCQKPWSTGGKIIVLILFFFNPCLHALNILIMNLFIYHNFCPHYLTAEGLCNMEQKHSPYHKTKTKSFTFIYMK